MGAGRAARHPPKAHLAAYLALLEEHGNNRFEGTIWSEPAVHCGKTDKEKVGSFAWALKNDLHQKNVYSVKQVVVLSCSLRTNLALTSAAA